MEPIVVIYKKKVSVLCIVQHSLKVGADDHFIYCLIWFQWTDTELIFGYTLESVSSTCPARTSKCFQQLCLGMCFCIRVHIFRSIINSDLGV